MLKKLVLTGVAAALAVSCVLALEPITAGPQKGDKVPGPFHPLNINGEAAGKKSCLFCRFGEDPVAMVFARSASPEVTALVKKLDAEIGKNKEFNACAIFCSDESGLQGKLEECVKKNEIKNVVLAIDNPAGPEEYKIAKDADVVVLLYVGRKVVANHAFRKGDFNEKAVEKVLADVPTITKK
jgi:hypothetical protein